MSVAPSDPRLRIADALNRTPTTGRRTNAQRLQRLEQLEQQFLTTSASAHAQLETRSTPETIATSDRPTETPLRSLERLVDVVVAVAPLALTAALWPWTVPLHAVIAISLLPPLIIVMGMIGQRAIAMSRSSLMITVGGQLLAMGCAMFAQSQTQSIPTWATLLILAMACAGIVHEAYARTRGDTMVIQRAASWTRLSWALLVATLLIGG